MSDESSLRVMATVVCLIVGRFHIFFSTSDTSGAEGRCVCIPLLGSQFGAQGLRISIERRGVSQAFNARALATIAKLSL